jgi:hypothetical protein
MEGEAYEFKCVENVIAVLVTTTQNRDQIL